MGLYTGSIDTDAGIAVLLSNFDSNYILTAVEESLKIRFRPFGTPSPNFVDILQRQFIASLDAAPDYRDQVLDVKNETYQEIIRIICNYYNLSFMQSFDDISENELYGIASTMYDIFITNFTSHMIDFISTYIIQNIDSLYAYLSKDPDIRKPKEFEPIPGTFVNDKFLLVQANINTIIHNMAAYDIPLNVLLNYFCVPEVATRLSEILADNGNIYKNYYANFILDQGSGSEILTCVKLNLQSKVQQLLGGPQI